MSFNGAQISGGTFYHVVGNMTQVSNTSASVYVPAPPIQGPGAQGFLQEEGKAEFRTDPMVQALPFLRGPERTDQCSDIPDHDIQGTTQNTEASPSDIPEDNTPGHAPHHLFQTQQGTLGAPFYDPRYTNTDVIPNIPNHTFTSVGGNVINSYGESGISILYRYVTMEALHDSGERFTEPACHPGTRCQILQDLRAWSIDTAPQSTLLWLHGSAGIGKSAIAQMFAGDCQSRNRLGASFFFKRGRPWNNLFTTIAYQLATAVPGLLVPIQQAVEDDKLVVGRAMAVQFQKLIIEPWTNAPAPKFPPIIVLDGLDECEDHKIQQEMLRLFVRAIHGGRLPMRILIVSRPEPHLQEILETTEAFTICRHSVLSADDSAYEDIRIYLRDEFSRINSEYTARGIDLGLVWPPTDALDHLVQKSSGIFIYAATVIRFVEGEYSHPTDQLKSILGLDPRSTAPLDDLYRKILSNLAWEPTQLRILHTIWRTTDTNGLWYTDPEEIDLLLDLRPGTSRLILRGLHSLFFVPLIRHRLAYRMGVQFLHASFSDYLCDARRSGQWPPVTYTTRVFYRISTACYMVSYLAYWSDVDQAAFERPA
ncbi:hypothetical protein DFH07DRAFT_994485 [Mycena maculata]|uniref:Nephrocystin 3-like N-terminal domain-containing protein n=1 Tax=Mycena maculata TaxID=230809 RepID=A0AAD7HWT3_9AGAR|nr:hypothetical protein DFH07DRAFT_994485 [Mycena maculata]